VAFARSSDGGAGRAGVVASDGFSYAKQRRHGAAARPAACLAASLKPAGYEPVFFS